MNDFKNKYANSIQFTPLQQDNALNILLSGQAISARGELLRNNPIKVILVIFKLFLFFSVKVSTTYMLSLFYYYSIVNLGGKLTQYQCIISPGN